MWFIVYQMAPYGREFSLGRTIFGVFIMSLLMQGTYALLQPQIGEWALAVGFFVSVLFVKFYFQLTFWRGFLAVFIYDAIFIGSLLAIDYIANHPPKNHAESVSERRVSDHSRTETA
jgi:hypothetical protein